MKTWDAYKDHVKKVDPDAKRDIEEMENIAAIVSKMMEKRNDLGITQTPCGRVDISDVIRRKKEARAAQAKAEKGLPAKDLPLPKKDKKER